MKQIFLKGGATVMVDDDDYDLVSKYKWHLFKAYNSTYARSPINGRLTLMHRIILNPGPGKVIDHINGNGLDNQKSNLRAATIGQNNCNQRLRKTAGSSQYVGVCWNKQARKWMARIKVDKKNVFLGLFDSEIMAAKVRDNAALKYHGDFAALNNIEPELLGLINV